MLKNTDFSVNKKNKTAAGALRIFLLIVLLAATLVVLLCATAFMFTKLDLSNSLYQPTATAIAAVALLVSCFIFARKRGKGGMAVGVITAALFFAVLLVVSLCLGDILILERVIYKLVAYLSAGAIGGILGVNSKKDKHY